MSHEFEYLIYRGKSEYGYNTVLLKVIKGPEEIWDLHRIAGYCRNGTLRESTWKHLIDKTGIFFVKGEYKVYDYKKDYAPIPDSVSNLSFRDIAFSEMKMLMKGEL